MISLAICSSHKTKNWVFEIGNNDQSQQICHLKLISRNLSRQAQRCEKEEKRERLKVRQAVEQGNLEGARIHSQKAIVQRNQQRDFLRLASRIDAVVARMGTRGNYQRIGKSMHGIAKSLGVQTSAGYMEKVSQAVGKFEKAFVKMEAEARAAEKSIVGSRVLGSSGGEVEGLIDEMGDECRLEVGLKLPAGRKGTRENALTRASVTEEELIRRLADLKARG